MIRRERRDGGEGEERGLRKGAERGYRKETKGNYPFEEEDKEHRHLPLLISSRHCRLDSAVKRCSSEVLKFSFQRSCSVKGLT